MPMTRKLTLSAPMRLENPFSDKNVIDYMRKTQRNN